MFNFSKKKRGKEFKDSREIISELESLGKKLEETQAELAAIKKKSKFNVQKIGIVRFNPFKEVGGDQSFSIALLDGNDSGAVITSLFTRQENRVYGKAIKRGQSEHLLSGEEKEAIARAIS